MQHSKISRYLSPQRVMLTYELPLNEIVRDFTTGAEEAPCVVMLLVYHHLAGYVEADLVKMDVPGGGEPVDAPAIVCDRQFAYDRGRDLVSRLRKLIPRQLFEVPIEAAIGSRVIARETVAAIRKNVIAKCYGGDIRANASCSRNRRRQEAHEARRPRGYSPGASLAVLKSRKRRTTISVVGKTSF